MFRSYRLLLVAMVFQAFGFSAPVTYTINFNTNIYTPFQPSFQVAPTAGSFTFDASNMTAPFSNFTVTWDNAIFDLTNVADTRGGPGFGCDSQTAAPQLGISTIFETFAAPCSDISYFWSGVYNNSLDIEQFAFIAGNPVCCSDQVDQVYAIEPGGVYLAGQGTYSVSAIPEPAAFTQLLIGMLVLGFSMVRKAALSPCPVHHMTGSVCV
jgi:hypothetical protein